MAKRGKQMVQTNIHNGSMSFVGETVTVNSVGGNVTLTTVCGPDQYEGLVEINSTNFVGINCCKAFIELANNTAGGSINIQTQDAGLIKINTSTTDVLSAILVSPEFIQIFNGLPGFLGAIQINQEAILMSIGAEGVGASIVMTPESITFKVGETAMVMTAEGIVTECGGTLIEVSAEGINEEVGDITREMNVEGHTFTAAETVFSVGTGGLDFEAVTFNGEIESSQEVNASVNNSTYQTVESEASMTTIQ